jgi:P4 family phage/plasmid primase-like protien
VIERQKYVGPIVVDIDLNIPEKYTERQYTQLHIIKIINIYTQIISDTFNVPRDNLNACVFEKPEPSFEEKKRYWKDGFHIYYFDIPLSEEKRYYVYDMAKKKIIEDDIFSDIEIINTYEQICDHSVVASNGVIMYGSHKPGRKPYVLTHKYDYVLNEMPNDENTLSDLIELKGMRNFDRDDDTELINNDDINKIIQASEKYNKKKKIIVKTDGKIEIKTSSTPIEFLMEKYKRFPNIILAINLLNIVSKSHIDDYNDWRKIGWILYNTSIIHSISCLDVYITISQRSSKYEDGCCEREWKIAEAHNGFNYTINTLRMWAKKDNEEEYKKFMRNSIKPIVKDAIKNGTHEDVARIVYEMYKDRFVCAKKKENVWYEFQGHRWVQIEGAYTLDKLIGTDIRKEIAYANAVMAKEFQEMCEGEDVGIETDQNEKMFTNVSKLLKSLGTDGFIKSVMSRCSNYFYQPKFTDKLDENKYLIGFNNGVFDLKEGKFRSGEPDDMVSMTTGYDYEVYNMGHDHIKAIEKYFSEVFTNEHVRNYMYLFMASLFDGKVLQQQIFWTGSGANGKSTTINLVRKALGEYSDEMSVAMITQARRGANDASPEIANKKGKRLAVMAESNRSDVINVGYMKELTGGDKIKGRALYSISIEFFPQFTPILLCNKLPKLSDMDGGTARRICVISFDSEFVEDPKKKKQFMIDTELNEKLDEWVKPFTWLMLNIYYKKYRDAKYKIAIPEDVKIATNKYKKNCDFYLEWMDERLVKCEEEDSQESVDYLYSLFKNYYKQNNDKLAPPKSDFVDYFEKNDFVISKGYIKNIKLVSSNDSMF